MWQVLSFQRGGASDRKVQGGCLQCLVCISRGNADMTGVVLVGNKITIYKRG